MAQPELPRRDPSYRKPVPRYIPSPPPSPSLPIRTSFSSPYAEEDPPLPDDWRQVISKITTSTSPNATKAIFGGPQTTRVTFPLQGLESSLASPTSISIPGRVIYSPRADKIAFPPNSLQRMSQGESLVRLPRSASVSPLQSSKRRSKRGLHQEYRPPTPPLPAEYKKIKSPTIDSEWQFVDRTQEKGVYTDPTITLPSSVMTSPSIQTEKTWFGSNPSMTWTGGLTTCVALSDEGHPSYPTHSLASELRKPGGEPQPVASSLPWWERVGMLGAFLKTTLTNASVILCGPRS